MFQQTTFEEFAATDSAQVAVVMRERPSDLVTPVSAALRVLRPGASGYLLESAEGGEKVGRYSFVGWNELARIEGDASEGAAGLDRLRAFLAQYTVAPGVGPATFPAGAVGYLAYDAVRMVEQIPRRHARGPLPDFVFVHFRDHLVFDQLRRRVSLVTLVGPGPRDAQAWATAQTTLDAIDAALRDNSIVRPPVPHRVDAAGAVARPSVAEYEAQVVAAKELIARGDIFQVVLARTFRQRFEGDPFAVYRALRMINPSPFQVFLDLGNHQLVGSSPEDLVRVHGRTVETLPIAGTRRRGANEAEDRDLAAGLLADPKECAEHVMLVDLARNDIGRVSEPGTVKVDALMQIERYSHVMHMVSRVSGTLRSDYSALDALYACFPAGTVSGAPKIRAMEIIDEFEPTERGPYAGSVCYFDGRGNLDSCITIRTLVLHAGEAVVQAGAGIVADSDPHGEEQETVHKARAVLSALVHAAQFSA